MGPKKPTSLIYRWINPGWNPCGYGHFVEVSIYIYIYNFIIYTHGVDGFRRKSFQSRQRFGWDPVVSDGLWKPTEKQWRKADLGSNVINYMAPNMHIYIYIETPKKSQCWQLTICLVVASDVSFGKITGDLSEDPGSNIHWSRANAAETVPSPRGQVSLVSLGGVKLKVRLRSFFSRWIK